MVGVVGNNNVDNNVEVGNGNNGIDIGVVNVRCFFVCSVKVLEMKL